ncbi:MAG: AAA family ATPase [Eubacteriales bacterium]|nr:AAA family ATPase [Eubacteriales bacterium]
MPVLTFRLLQTPQVLLDGIPVTFPFKKAEALLYCLAIKKCVSREEAAALLWADCDETAAKKNLRHSLYIIRKSFGADVLISPQKSLISLNPDFTYENDYDAFREQKELSAYQGELLRGFSVKNGEAFESWLSIERAALREEYLHRLSQAIQETSAEHLAEIETLFHKYIAEEPFDEPVYLRMMQVYQKNGLFHKGIKLYQELSRLLNAELQISPGKELSALHRSLLHSWNQAASQPVSEEFLADSREAELRFLQEHYRRFLTGTPGAILISGGSGVGKTWLLNRFLDSLDDGFSLTLHAVCFPKEEAFSFQPWNLILRQLDRAVTERNLTVPEKYISAMNPVFPLFQNQDPAFGLPADISVSYSYRAACNGILKLFSWISKELPLVLVFDNLHHMDPQSLELFSLMIREKNPNILLIGTHLDTLSPDLRAAAGSLVREGLADRLALAPFSLAETARFVCKKTGAASLSPSLADRIYQETAGNAFFLELLTRHVTKDDLEQGVLPPLPFQDALTGRLADLTPQARQLLDVISLFPDYASLEMLESILNKDNLELLYLLDELKEHGFTSETTQDAEIRISFRTDTARAFVHEQLSPTKLRILHSRAAAAYEELPAELHTYRWHQNLIYHYGMCQNEPKVLQYQILQLEQSSAVHLELYPILPRSSDSAWEAPGKLTEYLEKLAKKLYRLNESQPGVIDYSEAEARLLYLTGKYHIARGNYAEGVPVMEKLLAENQYIKGQPQFHILCLRQMTFYGIQTWKTDLMREHIEKGIALCKEYGLTTDLAVEYRLSGLLCSMEGDYPKAQNFLEEAIRLFQSAQLKAHSFTLNLAACYSYFGELERRQRHFSASVDFCQKAIDTCISRNCAVNATFYVNEARSLLADGRKDLAAERIMAANRAYDDTLTLMGRSIARGSGAVLCAQRNEFAQAAKYLADACECAERLGSPQETGLLYLVKYLLLTWYPGQFSGLIPETAGACKEKAGACLAPLPGVWELELMDLEGD